LKREFRVPGGMAGATTCGIFPLGLLLLSLVESDRETILGMNGLLFGMIIVAAGFAMYYLTCKLQARFASEATPQHVTAD
jgi:hypothetical protein